MASKLPCLNSTKGNGKTIIIMEMENIKIYQLDNNMKEDLRKENIMAKEKPLSGITLTKVLMKEG